MAKKRTVSAVVAQIQKLLEEGTVAFGAQQALKGLRNGSVEKIFLSANVADAVKEDILAYTAIGDVEVVELKQSNEELGTLCKKPFSISVLSVMAA